MGTSKDSGKFQEWFVEDNLVYGQGDTIKDTIQDYDKNLEFFIQKTCFRKKK